MAHLISVVLIGYNNKKLLKPCLAALQRQTLKNDVFYIDNASQDGSVAWIKHHHPHVRVMANTENKGYAAAANQGIQATRTSYVMILNPDLLLDPDYLALAVAKMKTNSRIAALTGKILHYDFQNNKKTDILDTTGLLIFPNRRVVDRGQGERDHGQYDQEEEVFGISGACPVYRREALEDVKLLGDYLDEDFFMYKEDVDLSWRLRLRGWACYYLPAAVGYHGRGTGAILRSNLREIVRGRKSLTRFQKYYSYKNQRLMQVKNDLLSNLWPHLPALLFKEVLATSHMLFSEPYLLKSFAHGLWQFPRALKKRHFIMRRRIATPQEMARWFQVKS